MFKVSREVLKRSCNFDRSPDDETLLRLGTMENSVEVIQGGQFLREGFLQIQWSFRGFQMFFQTINQQKIRKLPGRHFAAPLEGNAPSSPEWRSPDGDQQFMPLGLCIHNKYNMHQYQQITQQYLAFLNPQSSDNESDSVPTVLSRFFMGDVFIINKILTKNYL